MGTIIALSGYKGSGKTVVANMLLTDYRYHIEALSGVMKRCVGDIFLWDDSYFEMPKKEMIDPRWGISPRQVLQHMGTDWAQYELPARYLEFSSTVGRKLWIKRFLIWYAEQVAQYPEYKVVLQDVRFPHEQEELFNLRDTSAENVIFIFIERKLDRFDTHESEMWYDRLHYDYTIKNHGTLTDLQNEVDKLMVAHLIR